MIFQLLKKTFSGSEARSPEMARVETALEGHMRRIGINPSGRTFSMKAASFVVSNLGPMMTHTGVLAPSSSRPLPSRSPDADMHMLGVSYVLTTTACNSIYMSAYPAGYQQSEKNIEERVDCMHVAFAMLLGTQDEELLDLKEIEDFGTTLYAEIQPSLRELVSQNYDAWDSMLWKNAGHEHQMVLDVYRKFLAFSRQRDLAF